MKKNKLILSILYFLPVIIIAQPLTSNRIGADEIAKAREGSKTETFSTLSNSISATLLALQFLQMKRI